MNPRPCRLAAHKRLFAEAAAWNGGATVAADVEAFIVQGPALSIHP